MASPQKFKIKHLKLNLLAGVLIIFLSFLGCWQWSRAKEKEALLNSYAEKISSPPLTITELQQKKNPRFYPLKITGHFDNSRNLLLDNKIFHGQVGYELYTPFISQGLSKAILVDRGFIPVGISRQILPKIEALHGEKTITGMINLPPRYVALGNMIETKTNRNSPRLIEYIDLVSLKNALNLPLFNYVLILDLKETPLKIEQEIVTITPERHRGYAVQWFALAVTLLILSVVLNRNQFKKRLRERGHEE